MIVADSCSIILLAKVTLLEKAAENYKINITKKVFDGIMKGKESRSTDALIVERLYNEKKLHIIKEDKKITQRLERDFNMGCGEASTIAVSIKEKCIIATDNQQGRKAALVNSLLLVGSPDIIVSLYKNKKITGEKAISSLKILKEVGWFHHSIIDKAIEDIL